jgi:hypothetical protein
MAPELATNLDDLVKVEGTMTGIEADIFWADRRDSVEGFQQSPRGRGFLLATWSVCRDSIGHLELIGNYRQYLVQLITVVKETMGRWLGERTMWKWFVFRSQRAIVQGPSCPCL